MAFTPEGGHRRMTSTTRIAARAEAAWPPRQDRVRSPPDRVRIASVSPYHPSSVGCPVAMTDLLYLVPIVAFFALSVLVVRGSERP